MSKTRPIVLGLRENAGLFGILVIMSAFVGAMVGFERSLLPELTKSWSVSETEAALLMVAVFGLNSGDSALIILANIALGLSQGFTWSTTVIMKIDIVGLKHRGTAMGLNESAGYVAVGLSSAFAAYYAETTGLIAPILYTAMGIVLVASLITVFILPETQPWAALEAKTEATHQDGHAERIFHKTTWSDPALRTITWTGVVNNANDGVLWAVLPSLLLASGQTLTTVGILTGIHAAVWGLGQLFTGPLSNNGKIRNLLWWGMSIQGLALIFIGNATTYWLPYILLGLGTAMVYPT
ncbi:MAG: MFS transporter, partial [Flavobacteriia bacterium]|nr:MFS transporter [Flavobacteriia bacterium]